MGTEDIEQSEEYKSAVIRAIEFFRRRSRRFKVRTSNGDFIEPPVIGELRPYGTSNANNRIGRGYGPVRDRKG